jgi:hypothetical protein
MKTCESNYALLVHSEEKNRGRFELAVYALLFSSAVLSIMQFAGQSAMLPTDRTAAPRTEIIEVRPG